MYNLLTDREKEMIVRVGVCIALAKRGGEPLYLPMHLSRSLERTSGADDSLGSSLALGVVKSERQRVAVLAILIVMLSCVLLWSVYGPVPILPELRAKVRESLPFAIGMLAVMFVYECAAFGWLTRLIREQYEPVFWVRVVNAALEPLFFTGMLALLIIFVGPLNGMAGPAPFIYFPYLALSALGLSLRLSLVSGITAAIGFNLTAFFAIRGLEATPSTAVLVSFPHYGMKGILIVLTGLAAGYVGHRLRKQLGESLKVARERDRAVSIFGQHVSPSVADRLLHQTVELTGEERQVCVMFVDIRDFSNLAAAKLPGEIVEYLNQLFGPMIQIVNEHGGIVNKFLGDGFMAVFGAPSEDPKLARNAVACAREILSSTARLVETGEIPPTRLGIGLHVGVAITGNVGSEQRKEYTVIGDTVNVAARIEQATKQFRAQLLVSDAVAEQCGPDVAGAIDLGLVELKGQPKPVHLYQIV